MNHKKHNGYKNTLSKKITTEESKMKKYIVLLEKSPNAKFLPKVKPLLLMKKSATPD